MDRALVGGLLAIIDSFGDSIEGTVDVDRREMRWRLTPAHPWQPGAYELVVGTDLEDLAGNALNGLFEVDLRELDETEAAREFESLPFAVSLP